MRKCFTITYVCFSPSRSDCTAVSANKSAMQFNRTNQLVELNSRGSFNQCDVIEYARVWQCEVHYKAFVEDPLRDVENSTIITIVLMCTNYDAVKLRCGIAAVVTMGSRQNETVCDDWTATKMSEIGSARWTDSQWNLVRKLPNRCFLSTENTIVDIFSESKTGTRRIYSFFVLGQRQTETSCRQQGH